MTAKRRATKQTVRAQIDKAWQAFKARPRAIDAGSVTTVKPTAATPPPPADGDQPER